MEIKKADSKGRVSGFAKESHYQVTRQPDGVIILAPTEFVLTVDIGAWTGEQLKSLEGSLRVRAGMIN